MAKAKTTGERIANTVFSWSGSPSERKRIARRIDRAIKKAEGRAWSRGVDFASSPAKYVPKCKACEDVGLVSSGKVGFTMPCPKCRPAKPTPISAVMLPKTWGQMRTIAPAKCNRKKGRGNGR